MTDRRKIQFYPLAMIGFISCSMLMYEILLTRISALRLFFHFSFLVVSNCLLGIGASGSFIAIYQERFKRNPRLWITVFTGLYFVSLIITYIFLITYHIRADLNVVMSYETVQFTVYTLFGAFPFFFGGCVIGLILTTQAKDVNVYYCSDLVGGGLGCFLFPLLLWKLGAGGGFVVLALIPLAILPWFWHGKARGTASAIAGALILAGAIAAPRFEQHFPVPGKGNLDLTSKVTANLAREVLELSRWSAISRIDMLKIAPENAFVFCLGDKRPDIILPEQKLIVQDCTAGTLITNFGENPEALEILDYTTYPASVRLKKDPRVFIIGVGGAPDVWAAKRHGASYIKGIELNQQTLDIHRDVLPEFSRPLIEDPTIELVHGEGRTAIMRESELYDVVQMTGIDTYTSLTSGAYMLAENFLYTVEAFQSMLGRLAEGGILQVTRQAADMETIRLIVNISEAMDEEARPSLADSIICLKTGEPLIAVMVKRGAFTEEEIESTEAYAESSGIEVIYLPQRDLGNPIEEFIRTEDKQAFIKEYPRNITPTTDDKPYFFNFTKWRNPLRARAQIREPRHVSQGNPLFILIQFAISSTLAIALILLPIALSKKVGIDRTHLGRFMIYFAGLGIGFIWIEIALMQKLTLFLGHPLYSVTVTLFAMLIFTGLGSLITAKWTPKGPGAYWFIPPTLLVLMLVLMRLAPVMARDWIGLALPVRVAITLAVIAPIGLLLGAPFAFGIRLVNRVNPSLVPMAWAVNGSLTVIGSILSVILSMNFGFNFVLLAAVAVYFAAFFAIRRIAVPSAR